MTRQSGGHRLAGAPPSGRARVAIVLAALLLAASAIAWVVSRDDHPTRPVAAVVTPTATSAAPYTPLVGDPVVYQGKLYFFVSFHDAGKGPREHAIVTATVGGKQVLVPGDEISSP